MRTLCGLTFSGSAARVFVDDGHDGIGGMGHDGAEDSGNVSGGERDGQLFRFGAFGARLWHHVLVECLHRLFETGKLHHRVRNLTHPERLEPAEECPVALFRPHARETVPERRRIVRSLDSNLKKSVNFRTNFSKNIFELFSKIVSVENFFDESYFSTKTIRDENFCFPFPPYSL